jgi:hypothetical protein
MGPRRQAEVPTYPARVRLALEAWEKDRAEREALRAPPPPGLTPEQRKARQLALGRARGRAFR